MPEKELFPTLEPSAEEYKLSRDLYISQLFATKAVLVKGYDEEPFNLKSGGTSYIYVDHAIIATHRQAFLAMVTSIDKLIKDQFNSPFRVVNVESKVSAQMCGAYTALFGDQMVLKGDELVLTEKGSKQQLTGDADNIALLDDVGTSGRTIIESPLLKYKSPSSYNIQAFVGLVREPMAFSKKLANSGIAAHWVVTLDELLQYNLNQFSPQQQKAIGDERGIVWGKK